MFGKIWQDWCCESFICPLNILRKEIASSNNPEFGCFGNGAHMVALALHFPNARHAPLNSSILAIKLRTSGVIWSVSERIMKPIHPDTLSLCSPTSTVVALTATEMHLLNCLAATAPEPVSRETLAAAMGHPESDFDYHRLEVAFSRLRKKNETPAAGESPIRAARGQGYVVAVPVRLLSR